MKFKPLLLLAVVPLCACSMSKYFVDTWYLFSTFVTARMNESNNEHIKVKEILKTYSDLADNYEAREGLTNLYTLNHTNEKVQIAPELYNVLKKSFEVKNQGATYFNPLAGSLSKLWKESLELNQIPSEESINVELAKMASSSLEFFEDNYVQRHGDSELDLGGIAKGYAIDEVQSYLKETEVTNYIIDAGSSSILLGEKNTKSGNYQVGIGKNFVYLELKKCFVSTSGIEEQGVTIGDTTYSHIVNPNTGSAINNYDKVVVISDTGYLGDALSTSMMLSTLDEIKDIESKQDVKAIVIRDNKIVYSNPNLEVKFH